MWERAVDGKRLLTKLSPTFFENIDRMRFKGGSREPIYSSYNLFENATSKGHVEKLSGHLDCRDLENVYTINTLKLPWKRLYSPCSLF